MSAIPKRLFDTTPLTGSAATYYTAPALTHTIIKAATVTNNDVAVAYTVTVYLIKSGGAASTSNIIVNAKTVPAGDTLPLFDIIGQVLNPGDFIQAFASTTGKLVFAASGVEIQ